MKKKIEYELLFEKIVLFVIIIFMFLTMYYYDNQTTFVEILNNMHRIKSGEWYYIFNGWSAIPYGLVLQGVCAIWALPIFVFSEIGIISTTGVIARLWYKLFVLIFLFLVVSQLGKLVERMKTISLEKVIWIKLFFLSSLLVLIPAVQIAQMEAIYLFLILLGINYYLSDEYCKFLLCFMIAIPGKYIPLFIFIPLVLLKEKRYLYIIRDMIVGCILVLVDRAMNSIGYRIENYLGIDKSVYISGNNTMQLCFNNLLKSEITMFNVSVSFVVIAFGLLCVWCFVQKSDKRKELSVYVSFISLAILFAFGGTTPYWIILVVPFQLLLIFGMTKYYAVMFPLELITMFAFYYIFSIEAKWVIGSENTFNLLLFSLIPGFTEKTHGNIADFLTLRGLNVFEGVMSAFIVVGIIVIIILCNPIKRQNEDEKSDLNFLKMWYWIRIFFVTCWILLNVWVVMLNRVN